MFKIISFFGLVVAYSFSSSAFAWERYDAYGAGYQKVEYNGDSSGSSWSSFYISCEKNKTYFNDCMSSNVHTTLVENYISAQAGDAYVYSSYSYNQEYSTSVTRYAETYRMQASNYDSSSVPPGGGEVYNHVYSDQDCQAAYGTASVVITEGDAGPYDVGQCSLEPAGGGACLFYDSSGNRYPEGTCEYFGDFTSTSTGVVNQPGVEGSSSDSNADVPSYYTEDPECVDNCVTYGGVTYSVDQSSIDDGSVSYVGSGTDSGSDSGSDSTYTGSGSDYDYSTENSGGGGVSWSDDGTNPAGTAESGSGDVVNAVNRLRTTVREGFEQQVDNFTSELNSEKVESDIDAEFSALEQSFDDTTGGGGDLLADMEAEGLTEQLGETIKNLVPFADMASASGCSDITMPVMDHTLTIRCADFAVFREMFAFILYITTAISIANLFFDSSRRVA